MLTSASVDVGPTTVFYVAGDQHVVRSSNLAYVYKLGYSWNDRTVLGAARPVLIGIGEVR